jgi:hypothetical protein
MPRKKKKKYKEWQLPSVLEISRCVDVAFLRSRVKWEWLYHPEFSMICMVDSDMIHRDFGKDCIRIELDTFCPSVNELTQAIKDILKGS